MSATGLSVLANIKEMEVKDLGKRSAFLSIYSQCADAIEDAWDLCFRDPNEKDAFNPNFFTLGSEEPEKLKEIAEFWNARRIRSAAYDLDVLETLKNEKGCRSWQELFESMCEDGEYQGLELYELRKSLSELDGSFSYGNVSCVLTDGDSYGYTCETMISKETLQDILEHPEDYAHILLWYV